MSPNLPFPDRRKRPTPPISRYLFRGRRRDPGPAGLNHYVDRPPAAGWFCALILILLSTLDALFSLRLFDNHNFHEMNPLLHLGLQHSDGAFLAIKLGLTLVAVFVLLLHWNFVIAKRRVRVVWLIATLIIAYSCIVIYEIALLLSS